MLRPLHACEASRISTARAVACLRSLADKHGPLRCAQVLFGTVLRGLESELNTLKADVEKLIVEIKKQMSLKVQSVLRSADVSEHTHGV